MKTQFRKSATVCCAALGWVSTAIAQSSDTNLANGSFESGFAGWTTTGNVTVQSAPPYAPTDGAELAAFNTASSSPNGSLSQTVIVHTVLNTHRLRFDAGNLGFAIREMKLKVQVTETIDGVTNMRVDTTLVIPGTTGGATLWVPAEYEFLALGGPVTVVFSDISEATESADLVLDNVRIDDSHNIYVSSSNDYPHPGVPIAVSPLSTEHLGDGTTSFSRSYYPGQMVTLAAPAALDGGPAFLEWVMNGATHFSSNRSISFPMGDDVALKAVYQPGISLFIEPFQAEGFVVTGPFTPLLHGGAFRNESASPVAWTAALDPAEPPWLAIWPTSGILKPGDGEGLQLSVTAAATNLAAGKHVSHIRITTPTGSLDIPVSILVRDPEHVATNGSFENGLGGWTTQGHVSLENTAPYVPSQGSALVAFNSLNSSPDGVLTQILQTETAVRYSIDFDAGVLAYNTLQQHLRLRVRNPDDPAGTFLVDGVTTVSGGGNGPTGWTSRHYEFVATGNLTEISFADESAATHSIDLLLDNVRVFNPAYRLTVTTAADEDDAALGIGTGDSLRETLAEAYRVPGGNVIGFSSSLSNLPVSRGVLDASSEVAIDAGEQTITLNSNGTSGVIETHAPTAIRHLVITGGNDSGIRNFGSLMLLDSQVSGNTSPNSGGGIRNEGDLLADRCTLYNNHSALAGGGLASFGDASLTDSNIDSNSATYAGGGIACSVPWGNGWVVLRNSTVSRNSTDGFGGGYTGLKGYKIWGTLKALNSSFSGNTAVQIGGGICGVDLVDFRNCTVSGNSCAGPGGGIAAAGLHLENSIVAGNTAASDPDIAESQVIETGANFIGGDPQLAGLTDNHGLTRTMKPRIGSPVIDAAGLPASPPATDQRGFPRVSGAAMDIGAVELLQATVDTLVDENDGVNTGGVSLRDAMLENISTASETVPERQRYGHYEWIRFSPALNGGTIAWTHNGIYMHGQRDFYVDASDLPAGVTISSPSGFFLAMDACRGIGLRNLTFTGHTLMWIFEGGLFLKECNFVNMTSSQSGGALDVDRYGAVTIDGCNFLNNHSDGNGGAIETQGQLVLTNCTFAGNSAGGQGGAIHTSLEEDRSTEISNCTFTGNNSGGNGGALAAFYLTLRHSTISGNTAGSGSGGGIYSLTPISDSPNVFENSIISGNVGLDLAGEPGIATAPNFLGGNAKLAPLANYGGRTMTMPPLPGSPVIGTAVLLATTPATDQRGAERPTGPLPDIGAVEAFPFSSLAMDDSDGDGIDDRLEPAYGLTVGADNSGGDCDADGSGDAEEISNMTDPIDPNSLLGIISFAPASGFDAFSNPLFDLTFSSFPGLSYSLEFSQTLDFSAPSTRVQSCGTAFDHSTTERVQLLPPRDFVRIRRDP